jgi:hypothetical protein
MKLSKEESKKLLGGLESKFKKVTESKKSENLKKQIEIRDRMKEFVDGKENELEIVKEDLELFFKKMEYNFKQKNKELLDSYIK